MSEEGEDERELSLGVILLADTSKDVVWQATKKTSEQLFFQPQHSLELAVVKGLRLIETATGSCQQRKKSRAIHFF